MRSSAHPPGRTCTADSSAGTGAGRSSRHEHAPALVVLGELGGVRGLGHGVQQRAAPPGAPPRLGHPVRDRHVVGVERHAVRARTSRSSPGRPRRCRASTMPTPCSGSTSARPPSGSPRKRWSRDAEDRHRRRGLPASEAAEPVGRPRRGVGRAELAGRRRHAHDALAGVDRGRHQAGREVGLVVGVRPDGEDRAGHASRPRREVVAHHEHRRRPGQASGGVAEVGGGDHDVVDRQVAAPAACAGSTWRNATRPVTRTASGRGRGPRRSPARRRRSRRRAHRGRRGRWPRRPAADRTRLRRGARRRAARCRRPGSTRAAWLGVMAVIIGERRLHGAR